MADYAIVNLADVPNMFESRGWPGEMKFLKKPLETEQVAVSYRRMPRHSGGKGSHGHRHKTQEEVVFLFTGALQFKLEGTIEEVTGPAAVRIPPMTTWAMWNDEEDDAELLIISTKSPDLKEEVEFVPDFWPAD